MSRRLFRLIPAFAAAAVMIGVAPVASAEPSPAYPSEQDVSAAYAVVESTAAQVGRLEAELARATGELDALQLQAGKAVEAYNGALVTLQAATDAATALQAEADGAVADVETARQQLGQFAADSYRSGGTLAAATMVLSADGPQDLLDRMSVVSALANNYGSAYDRFDAAQVASKVYSDKAAAAAAVEKEKADAAKAAQDAAEAAVAEQEQKAAALTEHRAQVVAQLAVARGVAVELEQQRQAAIAAEQARIAAAAAAKAAADAAAEQAAQDAADQAAADQAAQDAANNTPEPPPTTEPAPDPDPSPTETTPPQAPSPPPPPPPPPPANGDVSDVIAYANAQIGKWYEWGADGPETFDCSGLTMRAWEQGGVYLPHWSVGQYLATTPIPLDSLQPGDLVFFADGSSPSSIYHVGLYIGGGNMIEAPHTGAQVRISSIWRSSLYGATRV